MVQVTFEIPDEMAVVAVEHVSDLAHVSGLHVASRGGGRVLLRELEGRCWCGRRLREERRGPAGSWVRYCPVHGAAYQGATVAVDRRRVEMS